MLTEVRGRRSGVRSQRDIFSVFCLLFSVLCPLSSASTAFARDWKESSGEHFIVYFTEEEKFAKDVLDKAEVYYRNIATDLGYPRYSAFWLWDKRVKIYIYPDHASFLEATNQPGWSSGVADYKNKEIISYLWSHGFTESLLPHEIAHLIFRDFVGFEGEIPLWLDEGVAQWAEEAGREPRKSMILQAYEQNKVLSMQDLMKLDIRRFKDKNRVFIRDITTREGKQGVLFLDLTALVNTYYLQAVSVVDFLIERYGSDRFANFCRQLRDGKSLDEALKFTYPVHMRNLSELEVNWREYLEKGLKERRN